MLAEFAEYRISPAESWARRLGYLKEAIAIKARHRRCAAQWADHLARSQAAISRQAENIENRRIAVVLGAGRCLDIPLEELSARFGEVWLVDAVHLRSRRIAKMRNVIRLTRDLTGVAEQLSQNPLSLPDPPSLDWLLSEPTVDLVVSANLASQLSVIPLAYMCKFAELGAESAAMFHRLLVRRHFEWLAGFDCPALVICDAVRRVRDARGRLLCEKALLGDLAPGAAVDTWRWPVAPLGEGEDGREVENEVTVFGLGVHRP